GQQQCGSDSDLTVGEELPELGRSEVLDHGHAVGGHLLEAGGSLLVHPEFADARVEDECAGDCAQKCCADSHVVPPEVGLGASSRVAVDPGVRPSRDGGRTPRRSPGQSRESVTICSTSVTMVSAPSGPTPAIHTSCSIGYVSPPSAFIRSMVSSDSSGLLVSSERNSQSAAAWSAFSAESSMMPLSSQSCSGIENPRSVSTSPVKVSGP